MSPNKDGDHIERRGSRGSSSERGSSPLGALQRAQSLGPPNAGEKPMSPIRSLSCLITRAEQGKSA